MAEKKDITINLNGALIQHGQGNDRIYLMDIGSAEGKTLVSDLIDLANANDYGKIFAKIPESRATPFLDAGFIIEASVDALYKGREDGLFLGLFLDKQRAQESLAKQYDEIRDIALAKQEEDEVSVQSIRLCNNEDAEEMALLYKRIFASYPFPIDDPAFIRRSMDDQTVYACIEESGSLVALASGECDFSPSKLYAEMTDFATHPDARGNGYALKLLTFLEEDLRERGIITAYTIARAISAGMNITFSKAGYSYGGRLCNNTNIAGNIESMNVWYKNLATKERQPVVA